MYDVAPEGLGIFFAERLGTRGFHFATLATRHTAPEDVVLATCVNADDRPHLVVVRQQCHPGRPNNVQNGEIIRAVERLNLTTLRLTQSFDNRRWLRHSAGHDFTDGLVGRILRPGGTAVGDELV